MIYEKIIKPILFRLPIERAHRLTLIALRLIGMVPGGRWLLRKSHAVESPALEREVFGIRFRNPRGWRPGSMSTATSATSSRHWASDSWRSAP